MEIVDQVESAFLSLVGGLAGIRTESAITWERQRIQGGNYILNPSHPVPTPPYFPMWPPPSPRHTQYPDPLYHHYKMRSDTQLNICVIYYKFARPTANSVLDPQLRCFFMLITGPVVTWRLMLHLSK